MPVFVRPTSGGGMNPDALEVRDAVVEASGELLLPGTAIHQRAVEVLTVRRDLASDWVGWLRLHRELGSRQEEVIRTIVSHSAGWPSAEELLREHGISSRSARRWLAGAALPPPRAWHRASRILRALLNLQRNVELLVHDVAVGLGYAGTDSFSNQTFRYFGHTTRKGRRLLGLERRFQAFEMRAGHRTRP